MADATFFDAPTEASLKKHRIVSKYFGGWSNIVLPQALRREGKLRYVELFSGTGQYRDGTRSTPLLVLDHVIETHALRESVEIIFNDEDANFISELEKHVSDTPGIETLRYRPILRNRSIGKHVIPRIRRNNVPTLYFADPWGYQGISIDLIEACLSHWGSDFLFFFNYNRINMNLGYDGMNEPINEFFRPELAEKLRASVGRLRPAQREEAILRAMRDAVKSLGAQVGTFTYRSLTGSRPTHHLMCVSKHRNGMALFKEISARESTRFDDDVPSLDHNPGSNPDQPMLFSPREELESELVATYAGQVLTAEQIYHAHHNGRPYVMRNYRQALLHLEAVGAISVDPPKAARARSETLPQNARITFLPHAG
jgi:three-Cys-motif partner protein